MGLPVSQGCCRCRSATRRSQILPVSVRHPLQRHPSHTPHKEAAERTKRQRLFASTIPLGVFADSLIFTARHLLVNAGVAPLSSTPRNRRERASGTQATVAENTEPPASWIEAGARPGHGEIKPQRYADSRPSFGIAKPAGPQPPTMPEKLTALLNTGLPLAMV
jgi:hypothetical protein